MKILGGARIRFAAVSLLGAALAIAAPVAAAAAPATPQKASPTTTTTTKPGKTAAFAKLVIKASSVGHVNVEAAGTSTFKPAKNGQSLHVGDTVQTDASGQAEIDYADTAYTRLDVNTTFTIKKLTDSQGNRQVEGSLDVGRTYNRTAALTQSQTFQQDAGGATAAVAGTAFVVTCTSATACTFTAVIDNINLTGDGQTKTLNPLDECVDTNGALCGTTTRLTPDEIALIGWITQNVLADLTEHGIGDGVFQPFAATVGVSGGVVQSVAPAPTPTSPPGSPPLPPPPPPPAPQPKVDQNTAACTLPGSPCVSNNGTMSTPGDDTTTPLNFQLTGGSDLNAQSGFSYQFTDFPAIPHGALLDTTTTQNVDMSTMSNLYAPTDTYKYTPQGDPETNPVDSFKYQVVDNTTKTASPTQATVSIKVVTPVGEPAD
jgi:FecR protein